VEISTDKILLQKFGMRKLGSLSTKFVRCDFTLPRNCVENNRMSQCVPHRNCNSICHAKTFSEQIAYMDLEKKFLLFLFCCKKLRIFSVIIFNAFYTHPQKTGPLGNVIIFWVSIKRVKNNYRKNS